MSILARRTPRLSRKALPARALSIADQALLACGAAASLLYILWNDVLAASRWEGYSPRTQAISELSSIGAPSRSVLVPWFNLTYSALMIAFGAAVWRAGKGKWELRGAGALLAAYGLSGPLWLPFPMSMRQDIVAGTSDPVADIGHLVMSGVSLVLWLGALWFGGRAFGRPFRWYSLASAVAIVVFGGLTGVQSGQIASGGATPWLGVIERAMFASFFIWIVTFTALIGRRAKGMAHGTG